MNGRHALVLFVAVSAGGCGGNSSSGSVNSRTLHVYNGHGYTPNRFVVNGIEYEGYRKGEMFEIPLASDATKVSFDAIHSDVDPAVDVRIPLEAKRFILFYGYGYRTGAPDFLPIYKVRAFPASPPAGVRLTYFGPAVPEILEKGEVDLHMLPEGSSPVKSGAFARVRPAEVAYVRDFSASPGKWYLWATAAALPSMTLFKAGPFLREDRSSLLVQSDSIGAGLVVTKD